MNRNAANAQEETGPPGRRPLYDLVAIAVIALAIIGITYLWVWHNLNIWKRKGPRRKVTPGEHDFSRDWLGRPVAADFPALRNAKLIDILIKNNKKSYMPEQQPRI